MDQVDKKHFACGLPFWGNKNGIQTNLSIILRITAIVIGIILITLGALLLARIVSSVHLSSVYGGSLIGFAILLIMAAASIKYVSEKVNREHHTNSIPDEQIVSKTIQLPAVLQKKEIERTLNDKLNSQLNEEKEKLLKMEQEKDREYHDELVKLEEKTFPDTEKGRLLKQQIRQRLTSDYERGKKRREDQLNSYISSLGNSREEAMKLASILSGETASQT